MFCCQCARGTLFHRGKPFDSLDDVQHEDVMRCGTQAKMSDKRLTMAIAQNASAKHSATVRVQSRFLLLLFHFFHFVCDATIFYVAKFQIADTFTHQHTAFKSMERSGQFLGKLRRFVRSLTLAAVQFSTRKPKHII